jgi:hypothetical protein
MNFFDPLMVAARLLIIIDNTGAAVSNQLSYIVLSLTTLLAELEHITWALVRGRGDQVLGGHT